MSMRIIALALAALTLSACATRLSTHRTAPADLGRSVTEAAMLHALQQPGTVALERIESATWHFPNGVCRTETEEMTVRQLDARIFFYALRHPRHGLYLIDGGMPANHNAHMGPILRRVVREDYGYTLRVATGAWAQANGQPRGVFVTHLHYDHVLGVVELDRDVPVYIGPRDGAHASFFYRFINQPTREALAGRSVYAWRFAPPPQGELAILDVFADGSVFAIHVPGHTPGSTAFIVNATDGAHLITGDAVHSREAWTGEMIEANGFEADRPQIRASLAALQALAARIPNVQVHPGHQSLR